MLQYDSAKLAYRRVLDRDPNHAKVLQQLGWLYHQQSTSFSSQEQAIEYLEKSVNSGMALQQTIVSPAGKANCVVTDQNDAQSWYLLGRCYMSQQKYPKAYEAYQQAVYRDGRNPTFWCSIGVLYYQINQYRDALDAYSRAIRLNPNISEVWYDLGTLVSLLRCRLESIGGSADVSTSTNPATTRQPMLSMHISVLRTSTQLTFTSKLDSSFYKTASRPVACRIRTYNPCHKTCTLKHISKHSLAHLDPSGVA